MDTDIRSKINHLLHVWPKNTVAVDSWLAKQGVSNDLKHAYMRSKWLAPLGRGASIQHGNQVDWRGALYALQTELNLPIHVGGKTALEESGFGHFVRYQESTVWLYCPRKTYIPKWFTEHPWGPKVELVRSDFLPANQGVNQKDVGGFSFNLSAPERAMLELLYLVPDKQGFEEARLIFEGLTSLRPKLLQDLLTSCSSIKVKRLFLWMADQMQHPWLKRLDVSKIDLGSGKRCIVKNGKLDKKFGITIPKNLGE